MPKINHYKFLITSLFFFLFITIGLFGFGLVCLADTQKSLNTGNEAYPDPSNPNVWLYPLCSPTVEPASINLNWEIEGIASPFCAVTCSRDDGKSCQGALGKKDGLFNSSIASLADLNFSASDQVGTLKSSVGDIYQTRCCSRKDNPGLFSMCQDASAGGLTRYANKVKVVGCQSCEIPLDTVIDNLNKSQRAIITEKDFSDWGTSDAFDRINWPTNDENNGLGSGDEQDIRHIMGFLQCVSGFANITSHDPGIFSLALSDTKKIIDGNGGGNPTPLVFKLTDSSYQITGGNHAVIALSITGGDSSNPYTVKILDSDGPATRTLTCRPVSIRRNDATYMTITRCEGYPGFSYAIAISPTASNINFNLDTVGLIKSKIRSNPSQWLEQGNYPNITNFCSASCPAGKMGVCSGWVGLVLKIAYLGDFVGYDFHPNDGKIVGKDCDANHYPKSDKSALNSSGALLRQGFAGVSIRGLAGEWGLANLGWLGQFIHPLTDWLNKLILSL